MINLNEFLDSLYTEIKDHTGIKQLVLGTEDIPPNLMKYPRIRMAFTTRYNPQQRQEIIYHKNFVPSEDENFEHDVEYHYLMYPEATLSITAYGEDVDQYLWKAREWFLIDKYGMQFLDNLTDNNCVIKSIGSTGDRHTFMETEYEDRQGFDVILKFEDEIKVIEKTIEDVDVQYETSL